MDSIYIDDDNSYEIDRQDDMFRVSIMEDIEYMMNTDGWKIIKDIIDRELEYVDNRLNDIMVSMEETFSCKHRKLGVRLIIDSVDDIVRSGVEARALLLNNPTLEPSK